MSLKGVQITCANHTSFILVCPLCKSDHLDNPQPPPPDKAAPEGKFQPIIMGVLEGTFLSAPVARYACMNCGYLIDILRVPGQLIEEFRSIGDVNEPGSVERMPGASELESRRS